jgi:hypothetical protein
MANENRKVPVLDIHGLSSFQSLHENAPELILQGTRVICLFTADDKFFELSERFNRNEPVNVLDFLKAQRELTARMLELKGRRGGQEKA